MSGLRDTCDATYCCLTFTVIETNHFDLLCVGGFLDFVSAVAQSPAVLSKHINV